MTLRNESDEIIGTATTSSNLVAPVTSPCVVDFAIEDVPGASFYTIEIGTHEGPAWSEAELRDMEYDPELGLGDARIPEADAEAFCSTVDELRATLDDIDLLNNNSSRWNAQIRRLADPLREFAAGLLLDGEDVSGRAVLAVADSLERIDGYLAAKPLTDRLDTANAELPDLTGEYGCRFWTERGYRPA